MTACASPCPWTPMHDLWRRETETETRERGRGNGEGRRGEAGKGEDRALLGQPQSSLLFQKQLGWRASQSIGTGHSGSFGAVRHGARNPADLRPSVGTRSEGVMAKTCQGCVPSWKIWDWGWTLPDHTSAALVAWRGFDGSRAERASFRQRGGPPPSDCCCCSLSSGTTEMRRSKCRTCPSHQVLGSSRAEGPRWDHYQRTKRCRPLWRG